MTATAHNRPRAVREAPLYDPEIATPDHAERARTLAERATTGLLSTLAKQPPGHPYGSLIRLAFDGATPVFLISDLAEHTKNLRADARASLLIVEGGTEDPLASGRVTLVGRCALAGNDGGSARAAYLAQQPEAAYYADFKDFRLWRLNVLSVRYIGGFGRMSWVSAEAWAAATPDPLAASATRIIQHMNDDHASALLACCRAFSRAVAATDAVMTGIDRYGIELSVATDAGRRPVRIAFDAPLETAGAAREALRGLAHRARQVLGQRAADPV